MIPLPRLVDSFAASSVSGGVILITAVIIALPLIALVTYLRLDYVRHKRPLQLADPSVKYGFWHHIRVVTIPLFSYRLTFVVQKRIK
jgi:hypothetical protein